MGGGYAERPLVSFAFLSHLLNGLSLSQNLAHGNDLLSDRRDLGQVFAVTSKNHTQLMLEQTYLFADTWWEVNNDSAAAETFRSWLATSQMYRSCCNFMTLSSNGVGLILI